MIYIKTEMTQKPESCIKCEVLIKEDVFFTCGGTGRCFGFGMWYVPKTRPDWCPLVEIEEEAK